MTVAQPAPVRDPSPVITMSGLSHRYGERVALADVDLAIAPGEVFALMGPNGGGKTTLFRVLATLVPPQAGAVEIFGRSPRRDALAIRRRLGVVFQHPSVDGKLTVTENLRCHAAFYGLTGSAAGARATAMLARLGLAERAHDLVETLSGGLARRVELAQCLLHEPELILLDEPSAGLDPGARREFLRYLLQLRDTDGVTVVLTTHMVEEAERCDRVGIVHRGRLVAVGSPDALKAEIGGDVVLLDAADPSGLGLRVRQRFGCQPQLVDGVLRVELPRGHEFVRAVVEAFPGEIRAATYAKPTLEDVFVHRTGQRFWTEDPS